MIRVLVLLAVTLIACTPGGSAPPPRCEASLSAAVIDFGEVDSTRGLVETWKLVVHNPSPRPLSFTAEPLQPPFSSQNGRIVVAAKSEAVTNVLFRPTDSLLHLDTLVLRTDDGTCELSVPVRGLGSGMIRTIPEVLEFELNPGEEATKELFILNTRREPVTMRFEWEPQLSADNPFTLIAPDGLSVPAAGSTRVLVRANPVKWSRAAVKLRLISPQELLGVLVSQAPTSPRLEVTPASFVIPHVSFNPSSSPPSFVERAIRVRNVGSTGNPSAPKLRVHGVSVFSSDGTEVIFTTPVDGADLAEGESKEFGVRLVPNRLGTGNVSVLVEAGEFFVSVVPFELNAEQLPPCTFQIDPLNVLQLQDAGDGGIEGSVTFTNVSADRCIVDNPRLRLETSAPFAIVEGAESQVEVPRQGVHRFTIAGPKPADAGVIGFFAYHVLQPNKREEWVELRSPP